jgi:hypothetical protein
MFCTSTATATGSRISTAGEGGYVSETVRDDIRTTSGEIEAHAELLADIERRKQDPQANDEELKRLAVRAEALARQIGEMTRIEKKLVDQVVEG